MIPIQPKITRRTVENEILSKKILSNKKLIILKLIQIIIIWLYMDIDIILVSFTSVRLFDRMDVRVVAAYAPLYDTTTNISNRGNNV